MVQGSVLGRLLFVLFIDDLDLWVQLLCLIFKFADDTKLTKCIKDSRDAQELQCALDKAIEWANTWQMTFNVAKCKVIHFGKDNPRTIYTMGGSNLESIAVERDLGILIHESLKPSVHCATAVKKANMVLGQIRRTFTFSDREILVRLHKMFVRPHLEYAVQAWCPWTEHDVDLLESVQRRAVRMISGLSGTYEEKLQELGLMSLKDRRIRGGCG